MTRDSTHISVCVCTYKRPHLLRRLLRELDRQETGGRFTFSIVVADNDSLQSAGEVVSDFAATSSIPIRYCVEPRQSIALARNKALESASGEFIAFLDDDEFPTQRWLLTLFEACNEYDADGALGPVKMHFDEEPPKWVVQGRFYERPTYPTGRVIDRTMGRTNNVLLRERIFASRAQAFRPEFRTGEDQDFFERMIKKGHRFVWCNEAVAHETVLPIRWKPTFMSKRALLQGANYVLHPTFGPVDIAKSVIAVPTYAVALPFAFVLGYHRFITCFVKLCYHIGRLLGLAGINPIRSPYVTE